MWLFARKKAGNIAKKKKGLSSLEFVISILIFMLLFAPFIDIVVIGVKFGASTQAVQHVTRIVGVQGGMLSSAPTGYPGGATSYNTGSQVDNQVTNMLSKAGIKEGDYSIKVGGSPITSGVAYDYMDDIDVTMRVNYKWEMLSMMLPGEFDFYLTNNRSTVSEFRYRYDSW